MTSKFWGVVKSSLSIPFSLKICSFRSFNYVFHNVDHTSFFNVSLLVVYDFLPEPWIAYIFHPLRNLFISNTFKIPFQNICNITCFHHSFLQDVQCALNSYHFLFMPKVIAQPTLSMSFYC